MRPKRMIDIVELPTIGAVVLVLVLVLVIDLVIVIVILIVLERMFCRAYASMCYAEDRFASWDLF